MADFELMSDLHLDLEKNMERVKSIIRRILHVKNDTSQRGTLLLPGDVASVHTIHGQKCWIEFLSQALKYYQYIIVVFGNHEHYHGDILTSEIIFREKIISRFEEGRVVLLENQIWSHPGSGIKIAGCTLWSFIPPDLKSLIETEINDYSCIKDLTVDRSVECFKNSKKWLTEIVLNDIHPDIVLTHHAPLLNAGCSAIEHKNQPFSHAFESDLEYLVTCFPLWCHGHTHHVASVKIEDSTVITNAFGYRGETQKFIHRLKVLSF